MQGIDWGLALPQGNALANLGSNIAMGYQFGQQMQARRRAEEGQNALAAYATNPTREGIAGIAQYSPEFALQEQQRYTQENQAQKVAALRGGMAAGDQQASQNLQRLDPEAWAQLDEREQEEAARRAEVIGQAALRIATMPPEARPAAWDSAIAGLSPQFPELAQFQGQYSEQALNAAIDAAGLVNDLRTHTLPRYQVIPPGGMMVDTNNPAAVASVTGGAPARPAAPRPQAGQPAVISAADFSRVLQGYDGDTQRAARYTQESNVAVAVNSPEEAMMLPVGTRFSINGRTGTVQ